VQTNRRFLQLFLKQRRMRRKIKESEESLNTVREGLNLQCQVQAHSIVEHRRFAFSSQRLLDQIQTGILHALTSLPIVIPGLWTARSDFLRGSTMVSKAGDTDNVFTDKLLSALGVESQTIPLIIINPDRHAGFIACCCQVSTGLVLPKKRRLAGAQV